MKSNFLLNAVLIAAVIALVLRFSGTPALNVVEQANPKTEQYAEANLVRLDNAELEKLIKNQKQKTLFFMYASWCPVCKKQYPVFQQVSTTAQTHGIQVIALSVDKKPNSLARFLLSQSPAPGFTPYIYNPNIPLSVLTDIGSGFRGGIPYTAVINPHGKITAEYEGTVEKITLLKALGI